MTSYPAFCDHILHQNELVAAGICHGDTWNLIFINNMLGEILKLSPGRMDDEPFLPRLTRCGFDEVEESLSEPHGGELIAHHKEGSMYIIRWKSVSIDDSAGGEQVRLITMSKIPVDQINRVAELPWQELTVLLDSIHDGIWVIDSDGITLRVNKAMERIAGLRAEEVIGKHVTEPMHKGRFETCVTLRALIEKRSVTMFDDYSNGKRCLNTSTPIFDEKGNVWRVIASIRDMTELETLQRKLTDLEMETLAYKARLENLETEMDAGFVGHSAPMRRLRKEASKAARTEAITLILGETGTGKTLTAKAIHDMGQRSAEPFIAVNYGAIPMSLMESELFGYEKGAFTGAAKSGKPGMFELAHKGTLLLDEIGEIPLPMQAKLLQVLDGHPFHRVGGTKPITVDVRVIAATNRDLQKCVTEGTFREDLYYRLSVFPVRVPRGNPSPAGTSGRHSGPRHAFFAGDHQKKRTAKKFRSASAELLPDLPLAGQRPRAARPCAVAGDHERRRDHHHAGSSSIYAGPVASPAGQRLLPPAHARGRRRTGAQHDHDRAH